MKWADPQFSERLGTSLSVPSPLLSAEALAKADAGEGEGQGEGCHTVGRFGSSAWETGAPLPAVGTRQAPSPGLPLSPALPRKGGGSAVCVGLADTNLAIEAIP
ncbi:hypothetical protein ABIF86_008030 [Bradyrhizobium japonicum]